VERIRKPDPAIYLLACNRLGASPSQCVFLDDSKRCWIRTCAFAPFFRRSLELSVRMLHAAEMRALKYCFVQLAET
jgi:hypothetical protein